MVLQQPKKTDFAFEKNIIVDVENKGFTEEEIKKLAGTSAAVPDAKGFKEWFNNLWPGNRKVPPEVENLKSEFGYQTDPDLTNLITVAEAQQTPLDGQVKVVWPDYNFYIMQCGVYISADDGEKFEALKFEIKYHNNRVSTYGMLPAPEQKKIFEVGGSADIGVNGSAQFGVPEIAIGNAQVDASAKAKLEANFIVSFHYELKTQLVDAFGKGTSFCKWLLHKGDKLRNDVVFYPILKIPKEIKEFECEFKAYFKIGHPSWKNSEFFLKPPYKMKIAV